jgi:hypothetical protein
MSGFLSALLMTGEYRFDLFHDCPSTRYILNNCPFTPGVFELRRRYHDCPLRMSTIS